MAQISSSSQQNLCPRVLLSPCMVAECCLVESLLIFDTRRNTICPTFCRTMNFKSTDIAVSSFHLPRPPQSCNIQFRSLHVFLPLLWSSSRCTVCEIHRKCCFYVSCRYFLQTFAGHMNNRGVPIEGCFSPDSKYVISGSSDGRVHAWNADTGYKVRVGTKSRLLTICFVD